MADVDELFTANQWIYQKLHGDTAIVALVATRIYEDGQQPEGATYPYIVFSIIPRPDTPGLGSVRLLTNPIYQIKLVTKGKPDEDANEVSAIIRRLFQVPSNETYSGFSFTSRCRWPIRMPERGRNSSEFFMHLGGQFQFHIYPL